MHYECDAVFGNYNLEFVKRQLLLHMRMHVRENNVALFHRFAPKPFRISSSSSCSSYASSDYRQNTTCRYSSTRPILRCFDLHCIASLPALPCVPLPCPTLPCSNQGESGNRKKEGKRGSKKQEEGRTGRRKHSRKGERGERRKAETNKGEKGK